MKVVGFDLAFSLSTLLSNNGSVAIFTNYVATNWYIALEMLLGFVRYKQGVDMWLGYEFSIF